MKRTVFYSSISALLALTAGVAFAGGPTAVVQNSPVYVPAPVFSGNDWTGGYVGAALSFHDGKVSLGGASASEDDTNLGIFAGYNYDMGQYVVGAELSYDRGSASGIDVDLIRLKGRLGYDADRWMPYATLGLAHAKADLGPISVSDNGFSFGIGADFAVSRNFVLGAELTRSSFSNIEGTGLDLDIDTIQIRGSWKF